MDGATSCSASAACSSRWRCPDWRLQGCSPSLSAWGDFLLPLIFLSSPELQTLPLGLFRAFLRINEIDYGLLARACLHLSAAGCRRLRLRAALPRADIRRRREGLISRR